MVGEGGIEALLWGGGVSACWAGIWRDIWKEDIERTYVVAFNACEFEDLGCALEGRVAGVDDAHDEYLALRWVKDRMA